MPERLEQQLLDRLGRASKLCIDISVIVVYGRKCYVNMHDPWRRIDTILQEGTGGLVRVQGEYGYDMLAGFEQRQELSAGRQDKIRWFTPGWLRNWKVVYQRYFGWDGADANANLPGFYDKIIVLDTPGIAETYMAGHVEDILGLFDWTGLEVEFYSVNRARFKRLLHAALAMGRETFEG